MLQPILAAELIEILARGIPIILFILWLVGQAVSEKQKQANKAKQAKKAPRPAPAAAPQRQRQPARAQAAPADIEDEIDAFLRRAADKKGRGGPIDKDAAREETVILLPQKEEARKAAPLAPPAREAAASGERRLAKPLSQRTGNELETPRPQPAAAAPAIPRPVVMSYQDTIRSPLSLPLSQRQSHLGKEVALADDKLEAHLHQVFDHQLGRLQHVETAAVRSEIDSPIARSVLDLLQNPHGIQQMMVINEIMRRPEI